MALEETREIRTKVRVRKMMAGTNLRGLPGDGVVADGRAVDMFAYELIIANVGLDSGRQKCQFCQG